MSTHSCEAFLKSVVQVRNGDGLVFAFMGIVRDTHRDTSMSEDVCTTQGCVCQRAALRRSTEPQLVYQLICSLLHERSVSHCLQSTRDSGYACPFRMEAVPGGTLFVWYA